MMLLGRRAQEDIGSPDKLAVYAKKIVDSAVSTMQTMDEIVWAVDPKKDTLDGLIGYINQYAREFFEDTSIKCRLEMPSQVSSLAIPANVRHELFLVLKEALNNIVKHAHATEVRLFLAESDGLITVTVEDDGCGLDHKPGHETNGYGLDNMRRRMDKLGGDFSLAANTPGKGTTLKVSVNLAALARSRN